MVSIVKVPLYYIFPMFWIVAINTAIVTISGTPFI